MSKRKAPGDDSNVNRDLCDLLMELADFEKNVARQLHKYKVYRKAATSIAKHPTKIKNGAEAKKLEGVGAKIAAKVDEFIRTGKLCRLEKIKADDKNVAIQSFTRISGVGAVHAHKLYEEGVRSIEELKKRQNLLSHQQRIGLKYLEEIEARIPRKEIGEMEKLIQTTLAELDEGYEAKVCGSYRRGAKTSGDIDILLSHSSFSSSSPSKGKSKLLRPVVNCLTEKKLIVDTISQGDLKFMGICLPPKDICEEGKQIHRRIDIKLLPTDEYWCGLLFFTGSDQLNIKMRIQAQDKGFTLNERSIRKVGSTGEPGEPLPVNSEKDVFDYLGMDYLEPTQRNS